MSVINILDKDIYNKIAAGEVVEKPASVVKELVENSIDAGATSITIEILEGGIKYIKVSDNGCGIDRDDFDKVFLAHATSKIKTVDDLSKIGTLGFRGEALSSIASVSKITLSSKTENDIGYQMKVIGGELGKIEPIGATKGTYIQVEDLFYNIPVRKKFLRKPKLEENDITNYIARLIMANPNIAIKYSADNKIVYQSFGNGLYNSIYAIYGKIIVDNIFEFEFKKGDFHFSGYLGKPTFSKSNRTYQTLIINGRYVINQSISTAVYKAYENFIMKGTFPFFVINLNIPLDKVDVNVHPNKLDVKFEDSNQIFGIVYSSILDILYDVNNTKTISIIDEEPETKINFDKLSTVSSIGSEFRAQKEKLSLDEEIKEVSLTDEVEYEVNKNENMSHKEHKINIIDESYTSPKYERIIPFMTKSAFEFQISSGTKNNTQDIIDTNTIDDNINHQEELALDEIDFKVIGTLFNTYILLEKNESLYLIDQHAGHERLLYDKFCNELNSKQVAIQQLLIPYIIEINYLESNYIADNIDIIKEMGFDIEEFGENSYKISTVPVLFENVNMQEVFDTILANIDNKLIISKHDNIKDYIAKSACRAAVKAKDQLSINEINSLLNQINQEGQVLLCPHGRPILIEVTKKEIEKWFKRLVWHMIL